MSKIGQIIIWIIIGGTWIVFAENRWTFPFGLYTVPVASFFWIFGYWINNYNILGKMKKAKPVVLAGLCGSMLIINIIFGVIKNSVISIYHINYHNVPMTMISGIAGVLFMMVSSILISTNNIMARVLAFYGQNILTVLCTHYFFLRLIGKVSQFMIGIDLWRSPSTAKSLFLTLFIITAYYPIIVCTCTAKKKNQRLKYIV